MVLLAPDGRIVEFGDGHQGLMFLDHPLAERILDKFYDSLPGLYRFKMVLWEGHCDIQGIPEWLVPTRPRQC